QELLSCRHREALARAVRRNVELGAGRSRLAPPVAGLLARNQADAARVAAGLEGDDPDPPAVIEVQRPLEAARPPEDPPARIARRSRAPARPAARPRPPARTRTRRPVPPAARAASRSGWRGRRRTRWDGPSM